MRRAIFVFWICLFILPRLSAQTLNDPNLFTNFSATGSLPTGMSFLNHYNTDFFVIEKNTGFVRARIGGVNSIVLDLPVNTLSERGGLGIAVDPNFMTNGHVYIYYSRDSSGSDSNLDANWTDNRLSRFTFNGTTLSNETVLQTFPRDAAQNNGPNHNGGPVRIGPDGKIWGATGDLNRNRAEQNNPAQAANSALTGGTYRFNLDGSIPVDNPFAGHANAAFHKWASYGNRNTFGMAFDPVTNDLWITENGPSSYDEINRVELGFNSGWNRVMGPISRTAFTPGDLVNLGAASTYSDPEFSFFNPVGITAIGFLYGSNWGPSYDNAVLVGDNNTGRLYLFRLNETRTGFALPGGVGLDDLVADNASEVNQVVFGTGFGVVTDIRVGPYGDVYVTSLSQGGIFRISAVPEPGTLLLAGAAGSAGAAWLWRQRRVRPRRAADRCS